MTAALRFSILSCRKHPHTGSGAIGDRSVAACHPSPCTVRLVVPSLERSGMAGEAEGSDCGRGELEAGSWGAQFHTFCSAPLAQSADEPRENRIESHEPT